MIQTIAFREYVHLNGEMVLAFGGETESLEAVASWLPHVNYFGKRGGFFQLLELPQRVTTPEGEVPPGFVLLAGPNLMAGEPFKSFPLGLIQRLDEWGEPLTFDKANIYRRETKDRISLGQERKRMDVILPYRLAHSSRGYTLYTRLDP